MRSVGARVFVSTNGTLLDRRFLDRIEAFRSRITLKISLDGPDEVHDRVRGVGAAAAAIAAIHGCGVRLDVQTTTTLMSANVEWLGQTLELVDRLPCSRHYVVEAVRARPTGARCSRRSKAACHVLAGQQSEKVFPGMPWVRVRGRARVRHLERRACGGVPVAAGDP